MASVLCWFQEKLLVFTLLIFCCWQEWKLTWKKPEAKTRNPSEDFFFKVLKNLKIHLISFVCVICYPLYLDNLCLLMLYCVTSLFWMTSPNLRLNSASDLLTSRPFFSYVNRFFFLNINIHISMGSWRLCPASKHCGPLYDTLHKCLFIRYLPSVSCIWVIVLSCARERWWVIQPCFKQKVNRIQELKYTENLVWDRI